MIAGAAAHLAAGGYLLFEIGFGQEEEALVRIARLRRLLPRRLELSDIRAHGVGIKLNRRAVRP